MPELREGPGWRHESWWISFRRLTPAQQLAIRNSLEGLLRALVTTKDPTRDPALQRWWPCKWDVPWEQSRQGAWVEYRLGDDDNRARAIVCCMRQEDLVYLVARNAIHDHGALRRLVAAFKPK